MVTLVYKYINEHINEEELLAGLVNLNDKRLDNLIDSINKIISEHESKTVIYSYIFDLLVANEVYIKEAKNQSDRDLMLMICDYLYSHNVPDINQKHFDLLVDEAIKTGKDARENCFRLAFNYNKCGYNLDKIVNYFIDLRDAWYLSEIISTNKEDLDMDKVIGKVISTHDTIFIDKLLKDNFIQAHLDTKYIELLKSEK